ncbi:alpha-D-ribose 1-methylphosphonate 5-phosphate C-P-lyase PhnJ [Escherichia coli]
MANLSGYNFAYLDEQIKRMIRRAILKAVAIPGYQVPFWRARDANAIRLGNRRHTAHRQRDWRKRRAEGD